MPFGSSGYGLGSFGSGTLDFTVTNISPAANAINVLRQPVISFNIVSTASNIVPNSIVVSIEGNTMINGGAFIAANATGTINTTNLLSIAITINSNVVFAPARILTVLVSATTADGNTVLNNNEWLYVSDGAAAIAYQHISRGYNRLNTLTTAFDAVTAPVLTVTPGTLNTILTWTDVVGAETYAVYASLTSVGLIAPANEICVTTNYVTYTHYNLVAGTTYYYAILPSSHLAVVGTQSNVATGVPLAP